MAFPPGLVTERLNATGAAASVAKNVELLSIIVDDADWHTAEGTWSASKETAIDADITLAHDNNRWILLRNMKGFDAAAWKQLAYDSPMYMHGNQTDQPWTGFVPDDQEAVRMDTQHMVHFAAFLRGDCPETAGHTRAEHFHSLPLALHSEQGSELGRQPGDSATFTGTVTLNGAHADDAATLTVTGSITGYPGSGLLELDNGEHVYYAGKSGQTFTGCERHWDNSLAVAYSGGESVKYASAGTFTYVLKPGESSGPHEPSAVNGNAYANEIGNDAAVRAALLLGWKNDIDRAMAIFADVVRSDGTQVQMSVALTGILSDSLDTADLLAEWGAKKYGSRIIFMATNLRSDDSAGENYDHANIKPDDADALHRAARLGSGIGIQTAGVALMDEDTQEGVKDLIRACEWFNYTYPTQYIEVQPARMPGGTVDLTAYTFGGYTSTSTEQGSKFLVDQADNIQDRLLAKQRISEDWTGVASDEDPITTINSGVDNVALGTGGNIVYDSVRTIFGSRAIRFDLAGTTDIRLRWIGGTSWTDDRFVYVMIPLHFDSAIGTSVPGFFDTGETQSTRLMKFRNAANNGNMFFVRWGTDKKLTIYDGSSDVATMTTAMPVDTDILVVVRIAGTSGAATLDGQMTVMLFDDIASGEFDIPAANIITVADVDTGDIACGAIDMGSVGRSGAVSTVSYWMGEPIITNYGMELDPYFDVVAPVVGESIAPAAGATVTADTQVEVYAFDNRDAAPTVEYRFDGAGGWNAMTKDSAGFHKATAVLVSGDNGARTVQYRATDADGQVTTGVSTAFTQDVADTPGAFDGKLKINGPSGIPGHALTDIWEAIATGAGLTSFEMRADINLAGGAWASNNIIAWFGGSEDNFRWTAVNNGASTRIVTGNTGGEDNQAQALSPTWTEGTRLQFKFVWTGTSVAVSTRSATLDTTGYALTDDSGAWTLQGTLTGTADIATTPQDGGPLTFKASSTMTNVGDELDLHELAVYVDSVLATHLIGGKGVLDTGANTFTAEVGDGMTWAGATTDPVQTANTVGGEFPPAEGSSGVRHKGVATGGTELRSGV